MKMLSYILYLRRTSQYPKILLGRWGLESCHQKTHKKVDYANDDHCGSDACNKAFIRRELDNPLLESVSASSKKVDSK